MREKVRYVYILDKDLFLQIRHSVYETSRQGYQLVSVDSPVPPSRITHARYLVIYHIADADLRTNSKCILLKRKIH